MSTPEGAPSSGRSPYLWWGVSAIFVAGIIIALVIVLVFGGGRDSQGGPDPTPTAPSEPTSSTAAPPSAQPSRTATGDCQLEPGSQEIPTEAPDVEWALNDYGVLTPSSTTHGPATVGDNGVASCFSQDPVGALMAATHFSAALNQRANNDQRLMTVRERVLDGSGKDALEAEVAGAQLDPTAPVPQVAGFRFVQYTNTDVYITLALTTPGVDGIALGTYHLTWDAGDWYVNGEDPGTATGAESSELAEFTRWGQR